MAGVTPRCYPWEQTVEPLAPFDPPVARAVVSLLRSRGVPATSAQGDGEEMIVLVPADRRAAAFALLAGNMEQITALAREDGPRRTAAAAPSDPDDVHSGRPLVLERLRQGRLLIVLLLAPLLVATLARPGFPLSFALVVLVGGAALLLAWRQREQDREQRER